MQRDAARLLAFLGGFSLGLIQMGGCDSSGDGRPPAVEIAEIIVVNQPDDFTVALVGLGYSGTVDRTWSCSGTQARLSLGTSLLDGSVAVRIHDDAGSVVYDNVHGVTMGGLTAQTLPGGVPGTWRVVLDFAGATWTGAVIVAADAPQTNDAITIGSGIGGSGSFVFHADWDASSGTPVQVSVASGLATGSIEIRIWDPAALPPIPTQAYIIPFGTGAISDDIVTGTPRGTWTVEIDFNGCTLGGAISITN
jgi:hypothetical protein